MDAKTYTGISPTAFTKMRTALLAQGLEVPPGNSGLIRNGQWGIDLSFVYDEKRQDLQVKIERKPFLIPSGTVWQELEKGMAKHR